MLEVNQHIPCACLPPLTQLSAALLLLHAPVLCSSSSSWVSASSHVLLLMAHNLSFLKELKKYIKPTPVEDFSN